ncbi:MAG TPA: DUF1648 domain-containing protein [candidate division Zixibacteria bacterium]|nr:DUF1648 domain-containing protein [candidate division Zixibacteria bacterium]
MIMRNFWKILWITTLIIMGLQILFYYPQLPDRMTVHFDFSGNPDGWSDKTTFLMLMIAAIAICNIWLPISGWLFKVMPDSLINAPHKEFWLASEKNREKLVEITNTMLAMVLGATNLIFIYALKYTYDMNTRNSSELELWYMVFPIVFVLIIPIVYYLIKLRVPDRAGQSSQ